MTSKQKSQLWTLAFCAVWVQGHVAKHRQPAPGDSTGSGSSGESATSGGGSALRIFVDPTMENYKDRGFTSTIPRLEVSGDSDARRRGRLDSGFSGVLRATSEGPAELRRKPPFPQTGVGLWRWPPGLRPGCLAPDKPMSAQDFFWSTCQSPMRVGYIGDRGPFPMDWRRR